MTERGLKIKEAFRKKYGVDHPSQLESVKEKIRQKRLSGAYANVREKIKKTLLEKYGDENYVNIKKTLETKKTRYGSPTYNNREKMKKTILEKYKMKVSPNTLASTTSRSRSGEIGFGSSKFKSYLSSQGISNISQLPEIKQKRKENRRSQMINSLFNGDRLKSLVIPLFQPDEYKNSDYHSLYKFRCCKCGNEFEDTLYSGNIPRCLRCYPHHRFQSSIENEMRSFLLSENITVKIHDRTILNGNEIDILLPEKSIGIECNGIMWHSEVFGKKSKRYHIEKSLLAEKKGIRLLHVLDWEWINKQDIIKSILLNCLGLSETIYARKCKIRVPTPNEKSSFLTQNHIQGNDKSSVCFGLYYNEVLVSIMTFCKSRYDKKYQYEMSRFCNKNGVNVVGGASKLFSYFVHQYDPISIVSYCDKRFFNGRVYEKCGMKRDKDTSPNYMYFHPNKGVPIHRMKFQKHKLKKILSIYDPNLTEWQNMQLNGYDRIWDCGHHKYVWTRFE